MPPVNLLPESNLDPEITLYEGQINVSPRPGQQVQKSSRKKLLKLMNSSKFLNGDLRGRIELGEQKEKVFKE